MNKYIFEGKKIEDALEKATLELKTTKENLIIIATEEKQKLLKKNIKIEVININELIEYIKDTIKEITSLMNIEVKLEIRRSNTSINITIYSNNNAILIGKNGKTIQALQNVIRQIVPNIVNEQYKIMLDVENYKEKRITNLEKIAKIVAKEVSQTGVETKLERMNSYERRIIHNTLTDNKYVYTESVGEEPNRCIVIKPKQES